VLLVGSGHRIRDQVAALKSREGCRAPSETVLAGVAAAATVATVWTIGYEDRDLGTLVDVLQDTGVQRVVDVRETPRSRKKGLSKGPLSEALGEVGIAYENRKSLGVPKAVRDPYKAGGSWEDFAAWYIDHLEALEEEVEGLREVATRERVALLCYEADASGCHRGLLAARVAGPGLRVEHL